MQQETKPKLDLEGIYRLDNDRLVNRNLILSVGERHQPKKGQAKRFMGAIDSSKPEVEQYSYISSLYSKQGARNTYSLEYRGQHYELSITGLNTVAIKKVEKEPALAFTESSILEGEG